MGKDYDNFHHTNGDDIFDKDDARWVDAKAAEIFHEETGPGRHVFDHVKGKNLSLNWQITYRYEADHLHYDEDQIVFVQVDGPNRGCRGWLTHPEVRVLMKEHLKMGHNVGYEISEDQIHPFSTFVKTPL